MSNTVICVEELCKAYRLGQIGTGTLWSDLNVWWAKMRGKPNPMLRIGETDHGNREGEIIWALKDINFNVEQGEVLGIIGRNGAGKSTLLKILARVTAPTSGHARVKGRIASLLEVGTGFHPELTGRENIYLNGAILGMNRGEIDRKFDEIVAFAETEQFIDTPVKRYSSGMYVRLAFAVAAHLDPEILLVDEVLAVGDAAFQKKCLGKMGQVAKGGRTVLFVSHNMTAIKTLCQRAIWFNNGVLTNDGDASGVISAYMKGAFNRELLKEWHESDAPGNNLIKLYKAAVLSNRENQILMGDPFDLEFIFSKLSESVYQLDITIHLVDELGNLVFVGSTSYDAVKNEVGRRKMRVVCSIPANFTHEGIYTISRLLFVKDGGTILFEYHNPISFEVINPGNDRLGWMGGKEGIVRPKLNWKITYE
jgi:lipopolysaccharide transport system ATP-binding protein